MGPLIGRAVRWLDRHPWITSGALVVLIAVPGLFRVEGIAHDARAAANTAQEALENDCRTANAARTANQDTWASVFDSLDRIVGPDDRAAVNRLRADVVLLEPVDCDGDGDVDAHDIDQDPPTTSP